MPFLKVACQDFRNLSEVQLEPHPRFNIIEGNNGQGKTNLLEAVAMLATLKSFRGARAREMVRFGCDQALLHAQVERRGITRDIGLAITSKGTKAELDGKPLRRLSATAGHINVVVFGPDHLKLTKESPDIRRQWMDRSIFNVWPSFLDEARAYVSALKSRNKLLRMGSAPGAPPPDPQMLAAFDEEWVRRAARVVWRRLSFLATFRPLFEQVLLDMTDGQLSGAIAYHGLGKVDESVSEDELGERLAQGLEDKRETDLSRGYTGSGPHTHDLAFSLDGRSVRRFASQGQHRAFVLALKIAEMARIEQATGVFPVMLLDDISSELDESRNAHLMRYLDTAGGQVFITTTDRRWIKVDQGTGNSQTYTVSDGVVSG